MLPEDFIIFDISDSAIHSSKDLKTNITTIKVTKTFLLELLKSTHIEFSNDITFDNPLTLNERVRLGNSYMKYLAEELNKIEAPMTRSEMIEYLQSFDEIDPEGKMEVVYNDKGTHLEIDDVDIDEKGEDKIIVIS
jgi:hypothetical protein